MLHFQRSSSVIARDAAILSRARTDTAWSSSKEKAGGHEGSTEQGWADPGEGLRDLAHWPPTNLRTKEPKSQFGCFTVRPSVPPSPAPIILSATSITDSRDFMQRRLFQTSRHLSRRVYLPQETQPNAAARGVGARVGETSVFGRSSDQQTKKP